MHWRSLEGPLWLTYWGYTYIWCTVRVLHITAFYWCEILTKKLGGPLIILQTAGWSIQRIGDHRRGHFDWHTEATHIYDVLLESCKSQLSIDVRYSTRCLVVPSSYCKQLDGPFNAPAIIGGAALTDILRLQICLIYCWNPAYPTAFHWSKILNKKLAGPPIISQTVGWYISCTVDHQTGWLLANVSNKKESKCWPTSAGVRIM